MQQILALDITGMPFGWISPAEAVIYYATNKVVWDLGEHEFTFRGGVSNDGIQSVIHGKSIISIANKFQQGTSRSVSQSIGKDNLLLYARDRHTCAYCGDVFAHQKLSRDHILARCRGGLDVWMNCVTACRPCNQAKGKKLVEHFKPLLYVPYIPCHYERFILSGRNVLADQHSYLAARLPRHSRNLQ
jgi:hypothetical protein